MAEQTESRTARWKRQNRARVQRYHRDYYREQRRVALQERLDKVKKQQETAEGPRANALRIEAKEISLKLDRLRLQERNEKGAA